MRIGGKVEALEEQAVLEEHPFACRFAETLRKAMDEGDRLGVATFTTALGDAEACMAAG
jgi:hypothetical protein